MRNKLPIGLVLVAVLQFIGPLILPPAIVMGIKPVMWLIILAVFALLGINLVRRQSWARVATVFVQGFSIIVRLLVIVGHSIQGGELGNPVDVWQVGTFVLSVIVSSIILYYVDLPDVQILMT